MKMIKKVLAAVLAMAMVIGMMAMSTFAADKEVTVTVVWEGLDDAAEMNAWIATSDAEGAWGINITEAQEWPGDPITKNADGTYSITFAVPESIDYINFIPSWTLDGGATNTQTVDITAVDITTGAVKVTVGDVVEEGDNAGKYEATAEAVSDTATGDSSVMVYVVAAVVAVAAAVTVVCKRRSVEA